MGGLYLPVNLDRKVLDVFVVGSTFTQNELNIHKNKVYIFLSLSSQAHLAQSPCLSWWEVRHLFLDNFCSLQVNKGSLGVNTESIQSSNLHSGQFLPFEELPSLSSLALDWDVGVEGWGGSQVALCSPYSSVGEWAPWVPLFIERWSAPSSLDIMVLFPGDVQGPDHMVSLGPWIVYSVLRPHPSDGPLGTYILPSPPVPCSPCHLSAMLLCVRTSRTLGSLKPVRSFRSSCWKSARTGCFPNSHCVPRVPPNLSNCTYAQVWPWPFSHLSHMAIQLLSAQEGCCRI